MKKTICFLLFFAFFASISNTVSAKGVPIIYSDGPKLTITEALPEDIVSEDGMHLNLGVMFSQFSIFWVPMFNYGTTQYVLVSDDKETYWELDDEDLMMIKAEFGINTEKKPNIPFWDKIGGKIIWGTLLALIIWGFIPSKKADDEEEDIAEIEEPKQE